MTVRQDHSRRLTKRQLRARYAPVRALAKKLQAKGLISSRANLARAKPSLAVRKKALSLQGIFDGSQQAVVIPDVMRARYRRSGYRIIRDKVIIDKAPHTRVRKVRGELRIEDPEAGPFETVIFPIPFATVGEFLAWGKTHRDELADMMPPGTAFGFTFYGNNSRETGDAEWLLEYLEHYPLTREGSWQHFVLLRLRDPMLWRSNPKRSKRRISTRERPIRHSTRRSESDAKYYKANKAKRAKQMKEYYRRTRSKT